MGGKGSGGHRAGAGRRRLDATVGDITGSRRTRARARAENQNGNQNAATVQSATDPVLPPLGTAPKTADDVVIPEPPGNLTLEELGEWTQLAPLAVRAGTLTDDTKFALRDLCQARVLKDRLLRAVGDEGATVFSTKGERAAHPLLTRFTVLLQRVEAGMVRFGLSPMGKAVAPAKEATSDPFAEFDASPSSVN